jgi:(1->4)-alpha-D-glucan 1-alpha-D-glucosylmutase
MTPPRATYRMQLREHLDFAAAARLAPYLARLSISHLYVSPIFKAMPDSTHGYDAIDFNEIEPGLGGMDGFRALHQALEKEGVRLIVDFVPNHMAATPLNSWWRDVLEWGAASPCAGHFDVDWSAPKLLVPVLGSAYGDVLEKGDLKLKYDAASGSFALTYYAIELPLTPPSYAAILGRLDDHGMAELARRFAVATLDMVTELKKELASSIPQNASSHIAAALTALQEDRAALHDLHEAQVWRLAHWRTSRESLTYRRFFEISDLVGVRVENPRVFEDVHRCILSLVEDGSVHGLRIDHVDGLADPLAYLKRLQGAVGKPDYYVVVEKILGADEELRSEWPVAGTTGYEFIRELAGLFVDPEKADELTRAYGDFIGSTPNYAELVTTMKRRTLTRNLAGELDVLTSQAHMLAQGDIRTRDFGSDTLRRAIIELATALPVYRTYIDAAGPRPEDQRLLARAAEAAKLTREVEDESAIDFVVRLLTLDLPSPEAQASALNFALRLQQTTGPLMAKALEDTLFYRYNRLIALNEVGGDPDRSPATVAEFHDAMARRLRVQPRGLSATSTHDTKRGEDGRARIYAISESPDLWADATQRWCQMNAPHRRELPGGLCPEPEMEWFFYQSLLGAWPTDLTLDDRQGLSMLKQRMSALMEKATREAKLRTSWTQPGEEYDQALAHFVEKVLDPAISSKFLNDFLRFASPLFVAGTLNSLSQLLFKLTAPGVPDIYQGSELWDLSLVDPDNRCAVDFAHRMELLRRIPEQMPADLVTGWSSGAIKLRLLHEGLALRRHLSGWDVAGYVPLVAQGPRERHIVGFARTFDEAVVISVGARLTCDLLEGQKVPLVPVERWGDTALKMPVDLGGLRLFNVITDESIVLAGPHLGVSELLRHFPVALLSTRRVKQ